MVPTVECYFPRPTADVPNSRLPVLVYRNVLPKTPTEESVTQFLTSNKWEKRGTWGHIPIRHFHPNSHECYGIFQGYSKLLIGEISRGKGGGVELSLQAGDVIVLPAGTAHSSLDSSPDYRYIGVYPEDCQRWRNEVGKNPPESFRETIRQVGFPAADPVYGHDGPLMRLWHRVELARL